MNVQLNSRQSRSMLALAALTVAGLALWLPFGLPSRQAHAETSNVQRNLIHASDNGPNSATHALASSGSKGPALQTSPSTFTLTCFVHNHYKGDPPEYAGAHIGVYTLEWQVTDGSSFRHQLSGCGTLVLTVTGSATGADGFNNFICTLSEELRCALNIPIAGGGSLSGIPGQPTVNVPAGQAAVLNITSDVIWVPAP